MFARRIITNKNFLRFVGVAVAAGASTFAYQKFSKGKIEFALPHERLPVAFCDDKIEEQIPIYGKEGTKFERTFIAIKPDGVQRHLIGEIIQRFERKGYTLVGIKVIQPTEELAAQHYADLKDKPFYESLVKYISSNGPVIAMVWQGKGVITYGRKLIGATNPLNSEPGTIRGDFSIDTGRNTIHGSDSFNSAKKEISLWFKEEEVVTYTPSSYQWVYEN